MTTSVTLVDRFVEAIATARIPELDVFAADVELDATVPHWRFSVRGADAVRAQLAHWYRHRGRGPGGQSTFRIRERRLTE